MSITSAVANAAAAAAAAGAGKKAAQLQLQAELNNDEEWNRFLNRDGLLVVDVYTEWCGPCIGMVGNLKKIKVEIGGDNLHLAVAKADTIECLTRFRNRSEPTWMFVAGGQLINVVFGADAPRLARTIVEELKNEELVKKGERERPKRAPHELTPPEQEVALAREQLLKQRREKEAAAAAAARTQRREARARTLEAHFADACPALVMPHAQKNLRKVSDALEPYGVIVADKCPLVLGKDGAKIIGMEDPEFAVSETAVTLYDRPALILLLKKLPDKEGNVIELVRRAIYNEGLEVEENDPKKSVAEELRANGVPGLFVPADRHQRASALDLLFPKSVCAVCGSPRAPEPPHVALMLGAWQRRAALDVVGSKLPQRLLRYGFFADADVDEPRLLCKTVEQYEERPERDYSETIVLMISVGVAEPLLSEAASEEAPGVPPELLALGPLRVSEDSVVGALECSRFFPPGYSEPERKVGPKPKKKKKAACDWTIMMDTYEKQYRIPEDIVVSSSRPDIFLYSRQLKRVILVELTVPWKTNIPKDHTFKKRHDTKDETADSVDASYGIVEDTEAGDGSADAGDGEAEGEGEGEGEGEADGEEGEEEDSHVDKATSPPPITA